MENFDNETLNGAEAEEAAAEAEAETKAEAGDTAEAEEAGAAADESAAGDAAADGGAKSGAANVAALEAELAEAKDRAVRLYADFENFRRRTAKERLETYRNAEADILGGILPVVDNFERALERAGDDPFSEGVKMVYGGLMDFLKKRGVEPVAALDRPFDPAEHEAVAYQPSPDKAEGTVIYETRKGYRLADKVIRPASVIVSSGAPEAK